jgi:nicotinate-nucleotide pyrophosphorylase (carboxylating)
VELTAEALDRVVRVALAEDVGAGDLTTDAVVPAGLRCRAALLLEEPGVVCGVPAARAVFQALDPGVRVEALVGEGARATDVPVRVAELEGPARAILTGERTALNLFGRLCGIATLTARYADLVAGTGARILDTHKTTPGLRALEKYAVRCGGGTNHRFRLDDGVLIKDNHLRLGPSIGETVARARRTGLPVEVECDTLAQVGEALAAGADRVLLDNMTPDELSRAVELCGGRAELEASGGVTLDTVRTIAETGVDFVSVGALTHSARALDVSLEVL